MIIAHIRVLEKQFSMEFDTFANAHTYVCNVARMFGPDAVEMISSEVVAK